MRKSAAWTSHPLTWLTTAGVTAIAFVLGGCTLFASPGYIVYAIGEEGSRGIAVVQPSGEDRRTVIAHPSDNHTPVWSPDRQRIAFISDRDGNPEVYVGTADGSSVMRVTNTAVAESHVVWAPDGTRLAYVSPDHRGVPKVYWLALADLLPVRLEFSNLGGETQPAWSSSGRWIAFVAMDDAGNSLGIRLRNPDGVNQVRVTDGNDWSPTWSPDGRKLAFVSLRDGHEEIYVVNISDDGPTGQVRRVTESSGRSYAAQWSADSRRIAFLSDRDGNVNIYTVNERGSDLQQITRNEVEEVAFVWGADGRIVFESRPTGRSVLYIAERDGSQRPLSAGNAPASQPHW